MREPSTPVGTGQRGARRYPPLRPTASQRWDRRWHRALSVGLLIAVLVHLGFLLWFRTEIRMPELALSRAAGPPMGDVRPAGGGSGLEIIEVVPARPQPEVVEPVEVPVPVPEAVADPEPEQREPASEPTPPAQPPSAQGTGGAGTGGNDGQQEGRGAETGTGEGGGGTGEGGGDSEITPPRPRAMFLPPADRPASVRGMELTVWVYVDVQGRVVSGQTRLEPQTPDAGYNRRLVQSANQWRFDPARQAGQPVAAWYGYEIIL